MFTGLIEEKGIVRWLKRTTSGTELQVEAKQISAGTKRGDSVAVNGCCLTVVGIKSDILCFDLLGETLDKSNLGALRPGHPVNLERPLAVGDRLGGHFVQGHVDATARILEILRRGSDHRITVELPAAFAGLVAYKGSIALDGISLTVAEARADAFDVWIIPHTWKVTALSDRAVGEAVNLEFDILAKYIERMRSVAAP
jgi:riboflavin synthase